MHLPPLLHAARHPAFCATGAARRSVCQAQSPRRRACGARGAARARAAVGRGGGRTGRRSSDGIGRQRRQRGARAEGSWPRHGGRWQRASVPHRVHLTRVLRWPLIAAALHWLCPSPRHDGHGWRRRHALAVAVLLAAAHRERCVPPRPAAQARSFRAAARGGARDGVLSASLPARGHDSPADPAPERVPCICSPLRGDQHHAARPSADTVAGASA
mmetsp:Transcript_42092/g.139544  ORF Transcript_42092/g.139544 Transcript_42092/m.139544 type:complete len:216 (-) Transcript_42092:1060-1707(-)